MFRGDKLTIERIYTIDDECEELSKLLPKYKCYVDRYNNEIKIYKNSWFRELVCKFYYGSLPSKCNDSVLASILNERFPNKTIYLYSESTNI